MWSCLGHKQSQLYFQFSIFASHTFYGCFLCPVTSKICKALVTCNVQWYYCIMAFVHMLQPYHVYTFIKLFFKPLAAHIQYVLEKLGVLPACNTSGECMFSADCYAISLDGCKPAYLSLSSPKRSLGSNMPASHFEPVAEIRIYHSLSSACRYSNRCCHGAGPNILLWCGKTAHNCPCDREGFD